MCVMCDLDGIALNGWKKRFPLRPSPEDKHTGRAVCVGVGIAMVGRDGMIAVCLFSFFLSFFPYEPKTER